MPTITFAPALARWRSAEPVGASGSWCVPVLGDTLRGLFDSVFGQFPTLRGYVLDERGALRHHIVVFIDGEPLRDKEQLNVAVKSDSEIHVL